MAELNYKAVHKEFLHLAPEVLQAADELELIEEFAQSEQQQIRQMKAAMFNAFRAVDSEDIGILSYNEFKQVLDFLNLSLSPAEVKWIQSTVDKNGNGLIEYEE